MQEHHPLALVGLKILDGQLAPPGGAAPVDVLVVVVKRVIAQPLEFVVLPDLAACGERPSGSADWCGQAGRTRQVASCRDRRAARSRPGSRRYRCQKPKPAANAEVNRRELERPATAGLELIAKSRPAARRQATQRIRRARPQARAGTPSRTQTACVRRERFVIVSATGCGFLSDAIRPHLPLGQKTARPRQRRADRPPASRNERDIDRRQTAEQHPGRPCSASDTAPARQTSSTSGGCG